ncbi:MAG: cysteine-rich CWC family protein [Myxococcaceae bacterium]|nr:cysteine-rich CWC family protein [Myxococcaceae bacterium]
MTTPDPTRCPLCQQDNACGAAAGKSDCWCFSVTLDPAALAKLPEAAKGKACVCRTCGEKRPADGSRWPEKP